jgi:two-component system, NtrC family, sensor histidine kinase PilS
MSIRNWSKRNLVAPEKGKENINDDTGLKRKLQGLLLFRLVLAVLFLLIALFVQSRRTEQLLPTQLGPLYFFSVLLFLFTIVAALSLNRVHHLRRFAYVQLFFDVEAVTFLVYLSGGVESIFSFLYMPTIISGAVLLQRRGSVVAATGCSLSYGCLLDLQYFGWLLPVQMFGSAPVSDTGAYFPSLLMNLAAFYLTAYLSGYLAEQLRRSSQQVRKHARDFQMLETLHQNIIQSLSSGLLMVTPDGHVLFSNIAARKILALPQEQIDQQSMEGVFPTLDILSWPRASTSASFDETPQALGRREITYRRPDGKELFLGYSVSLLKEGNGGNWGWVFIFQDLTHLKSMEEHLNRMERMVYAGKWAAEIAHEIRNPLAAISGAAQMLQADTAQNPFHARLTNIVSREVQRIDDLVTDFVWLARGSQKSEKVKEVSVCAIIEEVFAKLKTRDKVMDSHRFEKKFEAAPVFCMDPQQLRQLLWYLMSNALEAMPTGGTLTVRVAAADGRTHPGLKTLIEITDTGSGISEENLNRVFEPFFSTKTNGTGLGLSIAYQMMENIEGQIELHSDGQSGTSVSLFFPFDPVFPLAK